MSTLEMTPVTRTLEMVEVWKRSKIEQKVARLSKRLAKMGVPADQLPTVTFGPEIEVRDEDWFKDTGYERFETMFETVDVSGFEVAHAGWTPVASLDHTLLADEALVALFPGAIENETVMPDEFRFRGSKCDHCKWNIRRNTTVVFTNEAGEWVQIGSTCILEFIGVDPRTILWLTDPIIRDDEFADAAPDMRYATKPIDFLRAVVAVWFCFGFEPTSGVWPTKDAALELLDGPKGKRRNMFADVNISDPAVDAKVDEIIAWATEAADDSDFMRSASLAVRANYAGPRTHGILAALPHSHDRHLGRMSKKAIAAAAAEQARNASKFVGQIDEKVTVEGTVTTFVTVDTVYGTSLRVSVTTDDDETVTTFGSGRTLWNVGVGDRVRWTGKVKSHENSDRFGKQTECKMVKLVVLDEAAAA